MPGRGLNLLSLDGGGVRGVSSLQVLKNLLERVARERGLPEPPKPCDFFDMIAGTSTGGLIAIMLGRMKMSIDQCMEAYIELAEKVFRQTHSLPFSLSGKVRGRFDSRALEDAVKEYLVKHSLPEDCLLQDVSSASCKVFVCATSGSTSKIVLLRSYATQRTNPDSLKYTKVWQAARATSAASGFFDPITVQFGAYKESYTDGATGANNPINYLWHEAKEAFLDPDENLEDHLDCVISVGTGVPAIEPFGSSLKSIAKTVVKISTETEETAKVFRRNHPDLTGSGRYFRLNVSHGLEVIGLEKVDRKHDIINITNLYLDSDETNDLMIRCVQTLVQHESGDRPWYVADNQIIRFKGHRSPKPDGQSVHMRRERQSLVQRDNVSLLDNISSYDYETRLLCISTRLVPGTAGWIFHNPDYVHWRHEKSRPFFMCTGIVGSGKTMIASLVVERLLQVSNSASHIIAHYFLDTKYPGELSATALLRGIIKQVSCQLQRSGQLPRDLRQVIQERFPSRRVFRSVLELHLVLHRLLAASSECTIIIDGLHELPERDAAEVLGIFRLLGCETSLAEKLKFAIFCREQVSRNVNIETALPNAVRLRLTLDLLQKDIAFFIDESVRYKTMYERQLTDNEVVLNDVRSILQDHGEKMFLWIDLQLCTIWRTCFSDEDIRLALDRLPAGIEETYSRCLSRVSQDDIGRKYGHRILYLTTHVQRPLTVDELREAMSVPEMHDHWDESKEIRGQLVQFCANLVEQDHVTATVRLVHPSLKAFLDKHFYPARYQATSILTSKRYYEADTFELVGTEYCRDVCFKYLTMRDFGSQVALRNTVQTNFSKTEILDKSLDGNRVLRWARRRLIKERKHKSQQVGTLDRPSNPVQAPDTANKFHLLVYVQEHWPAHVCSLEPSDPLWATFVEIAMSMNGAYKFHPWMEPGMKPAQFQRALFLYAVDTNAMHLLQALENALKRSKLESLTEIQLDEGKTRPVHIVAQKGTEKIMRWLLKTGGVKQLQWKTARGDTALHASANTCNVGTLKIMLEYVTAEVLLYEEGSLRSAPLVVAAINGHTEYVQIAMQALAPRRSATNLQIALERVLEYRPNATGRLGDMEPSISAFLAGLLDVHGNVSWTHLVELALDDDVLVFFDAFLDHPSSTLKIQGTLKNKPPEAPVGTTLLTRACAFSETTKPERALIVKALLEHLPTEVTWSTLLETKQEEDENGVQEKAIFATPLSLALAGVAVSDVAVEVVSILSEHLCTLSKNGTYVPQMIQEIGSPPVGNLDYLELLPKINPDSVERLLTCGTLKLQQHFINNPKDNLLHVAVMQETDGLLRAISQYQAQKKNSNLVYSLTAPGHRGKTAPGMAFVDGSEEYLNLVQDIAKDSLLFEDVFFRQRCKDGSIFRGQVMALILELLDIRSAQVRRTPRTGHMPNRQNMLNKLSQLDNYILDLGNVESLDLGFDLESLQELSSRKRQAMAEFSDEYWEKFREEIAASDRVRNSRYNLSSTSGQETNNTGQKLATMYSDESETEEQPHTRQEDQLDVDTTRRAHSPVTDSLPHAERKEPCEDERSTPCVDIPPTVEALDEWKVPMIPGGWVD